MNSEKFLHTMLVAIPALFFAESSFAQDSTNTFNPQSIFSSVQNVSGAGGFLLGASTLGGKSSFLASGRGAAIIDHFLEIGGAGTGVSRTIDSVNGKEQRLSLGYGGLSVGVVPQSENLVHARAHILLGVGGANITTQTDSHQDMNSNMDGKTFGILEPSAAIEVNLFRYGRTYLEVSWRHVWGGATVGNFKANDLSSWTTGLGFRFGEF